jgi:aspartate/methionine/tyrosine aminotransferase
MQRAAVAALDRGESFVEHQITRARRGREIVCDALASTGRCRFVKPPGAFYLFFAVAGETDVWPLVQRLIDEAQVGLAPGTAFGAGGEGFVRLCFARSADDLNTAAQRIAAVLSRHHSA